MTRLVGTTTKWRRADDVLTRRSPRSVLVLAWDVDEPIVLEGGAVAVWDRLAQPISDEQLVDAVAAQFDLDAAGVRDVVVSTREALRRAGAIVEA